MGQAIPNRHPAVVLRSSYKQLQGLLVVTMIAVVGLTAAVVVLATNDDGNASAGSATQVVAPGTADGIRYDGGPEEGTAAALTARSGPASSDLASTRQPAGVRYDGGPEEGSRGLVAERSSPSTRYDGGPEEGSRGSGN